MTDHGHGHARSPAGSIGEAFFLNLAFTFVEIAGGLWTGSVAILADAVHDLGDSISLGAAWLFERLSRRSPDATFTFGYGRFSLLGAFVNALVLLTGSVLVIVRSVPRLFDPEIPNASGMIALAALGILANGAAALRVRRGRSLNERMVMWHLLEDALGWFAVLAAGLVLKFARWPILDPLLSLMITALILYQAAKGFIRIMRVFLQAVPEGVAVEEIRMAIREIPGVLDAHHIHLWTLEGERNMATAHVVVEGGFTLEAAAALKKDIREALAKKNVGCTTLEFEKSGEMCAACNTGNQCRP